MSEDNKRNLLFFEAPTMRELFADMDEWQATNRKRLQSVSVQPDGNGFACIALSNPTEVIIVNGYGKGGALVADNSLATHDMKVDHYEQEAGRDTGYSEASKTYTRAVLEAREAIHAVNK